MSYCPNCSKELPDGTAYCNYCGTPVNQLCDPKEEQEFLDLTHRLLRWEQKAWRICGNVFIGLGIGFFAFWSLYGLIGLALMVEEPEAGVVFTMIGFLYAFLFGGMFAAIGIVCKVASQKIPYYLDTLYTDFRPALNRCGSIGMIVFTAFFNEIALVFFVINFVRIKSNRKTIDRILSRQQVR